MALDHWDAIRLRARAKHAAARGAAGGRHSARALLRAARELTGLRCEPLASDDPLLCRTAKAVLQDDIIWFNDEVPEWEAQFNQFHEFAHHWLDGRGAACGAGDLDPEASEDSVELGARRVEGYSPHERRELEANVFAREFMLPGDYLRAQFLAGRTAADIAAEVGVPDGMVFHQLTRALLGPGPTEPCAVEEGPRGVYQLDESQARAAHAGWREPARPVLVDAGPGTGKTRALVGRVRHLLGERGVHASNILALTYSNRAAEEMYARVRAVAPQDAALIMMGTFHAFGLELLRKYHDRLGLKSRPQLIDPLEARLLLERSLARLKLRHYRYLPNPSAPLADMLGAISRAKDELKRPADYEAAARAQLEEAAGAGARRKAEQALEVAGVYAEYERLLRERNSLDYGDLICKAVWLLREHEELRDALRAKYRYILVDEYQDVNTGSRLLLKLLAGDGRGLWVVGDLRQAIYRFRGASPLNMRLLTSEDFPDARVISLKKNYRSQRAVVRLFERCASRMRANAGRAQEPWDVVRAGSGGEVRYRVSADEEAEARGLVAEVERLRAAGVEYREQAVLCRSHKALAELGATLEEAGVPVLYLGNFFERPEVRDLLSVVSLAGEGDGRALFRLARFAEYDFSYADAQALARHSFERQRHFPAALRFVSEVAGLSDDGRQKLSRLAGHLADFDYVTTPWRLLVEYLFVKSDYLRRLVADATPQAQQRRLAIYQLLLLAYQLKNQFDPEAGDPKGQFLDYVRRLKAHREERSLRRTPDWADGIDAVRMLTIHASKGLEFGAVHMPRLGERQFPAPKLADRCPLPPGLLPAEMLDWHAEEEECLFFVGLSRSRDRLSLSRARHYGRSPSDESSLLQLVRDQLPPAIDGDEEAVRAACAARRPEAPATQMPARPFSEAELSLYLKCPREYYYRYVIRLGDRRAESAYAQSHLCVHRVWETIEERLSAGDGVDEETVSAVFEEVWKRSGPGDHPWQEDYRNEALSMVGHTLVYTSKGTRVLRPLWTLRLPSGEVLVRPDYAEVDESGPQPSVLVQEVCFGPSPSRSPVKDHYALYDLAAAAYPNARRVIQAVYMSNGAVLEVKVTAGARKAAAERYDRAILGILRGEFEARPEERHCPYCPCFFICPASEETPA